MDLISVRGSLYHNFSIYVAHYTNNSLSAEKNVKRDMQCIVFFGDFEAETAVA
jgi:hypothetical protein